jgi:23S rRNA-/tRNA-specific pseudouridylate synthase
LDLVSLEAGLWAYRHQNQRYLANKRMAVKVELADVTRHVPALKHIMIDFEQSSKPVTSAPGGEDPKWTYQSAIEALSHEAWTLEQQATLPEQGILHRLDNDTSGLVMCATNLDSYNAYRYLRDNAWIQPRYQARVIVSTRSPFFAALQEVCDGRTIRARDGPYGLQYDASRLDDQHIRISIKSQLESRGDQVFVHYVLKPTPKAGMLQFWEGTLDEEQRNIAYNSGNRVSHVDIPLKRAKQLLKQPAAYRLYLDVHCTFARGMRHQLRAHLSAMGAAIDGDDFYGMPRLAGEKSMRLKCTGYQLLEPRRKGKQQASIIV